MATARFFEVRNIAIATMLHVVRMLCLANVGILQCPQDYKHKMRENIEVIYAAIGIAETRMNV